MSQVKHSVHALSTPIPLRDGVWCLNIRSSRTRRDGGVIHEDASTVGLQRTTWRRCCLWLSRLYA